MIVRWRERDSPRRIEVTNDGFSSREKKGIHFTMLRETLIIEVLGF